MHFRRDLLTYNSRYYINKMRFLVMYYSQILPIYIVKYPVLHQVFLKLDKGGIFNSSMERVKISVNLINELNYNPIARTSIPGLQ